MSEYEGLRSLIYVADIQMKQKIANSPFYDRLYHPDRPVIVFDGAMGSNLQLQDLTAADFGGEKYEGCNEYLVHTKPESVATVHRAFLAAGADVIETDTFGGTSLTLAEYDLADRAYELNKTAAELAKKVTAEFTTPEKPRFVAGSIGPGTKLPSIGHIDYDTLETAYAEQARGLLDGGVDLFLVETCMDVLQIKAALNGIETVFAEVNRRIPLMVSATFEEMGTMLAGSDITALVTTLEPYSIDILGLNCATGPDLMSPHIKYLCETSPFIVSCVPNAGLPENIGGHAHYKLTPIELKIAVMRFVEDWGVQVIGGCCGTSPAHIQQLAEIAQEVQPKKREPAYEASASSLMTSQSYFQENSFLIVGERLNASGSKKCRDLLNAEDWDGLVSLARAQVKEGAQVLDINVDYVGRDGVRDMREVVSRVVNSVNLPLMLDSTEWEKMEAGLKVAGGKCLINSTNFEDGDERFFKVLSLAKKYGGGVVIGTIDEDGMARTAEKKFEIAQRAYRAAVEYGISPQEIFFDTLVLPISTGIEEDRANARETIKATKTIRENLPGCHVILGVSNVSFGLNPASRQVLNSVFLHEAMAAGMDAAIVSANKILPMAKISAEHQKVCQDLIFDRREFKDTICTYDPLGALTTMFMGVTTKKDKVADDKLPINEKLKNHIIDGERLGLEDNLNKAMVDHPPLTIINSFLLDGMKVVGELFGSGQMQLPFVLQSAETMKAAVAFLEPHMETSESGNNSKGTFLIATVKGDVHDIGKNLVDIILSNNGYTVLNIGIKQPVENILEAYKKQPVDCIAMSGLLVKSTAFMKENLEVFNKNGITVPVILGGAALTPKFVYDDCQKVYQGKVIYGKDAFADLNFMDQLMPAKAQQQWSDDEGFHGDFAQYNPKLEKAIDNQPKPEKVSTEPVVIDTKRSEDVELDLARPTPPFWGTKILQPADIPIEELFWHLDLQALIAGQWQFRKPQDQTKEDYEAFKAEKVYPILESWKAKLQAEEWLHPQLVYGYFPCVAEGNSLHVYDPAVIEQGLTPQTAQPAVTWEFPRQRSLRRLCIADFFRPIAENQFDVFPLQAVTMGEIATTKAKVLFDANNYTEYLYFHGMAVQMAEALAEWGHARVRRELGYGNLEPDNIRDMLAQRYQGSRYSFGYPACPNVMDQVPQLNLLQVERIGMSIDESEQLYPEQSTTALMVYHPKAKYFSA
jgi:5-methyltetrahydrofolate--homocysteine methyltransferase